MENNQMNSEESPVIRKKRVQWMATTVGLVALAIAVGVGFQNCSSQPTDLSGFNNTKSGSVPAFGPTLTPVPTVPAGFPTVTPPGPTPTPDHSGGGGGNATCSLSLSPANSPAIYGVNTSLSVLVSYSGTPAASRTCLRVRMYNSSTNAYETYVPGSSCTAFSPSISIPINTQGYFSVDATFTDANFFTLPCNTQASPTLFSVSTTGGGGGGNFSVNSYQQAALDVSLNQYFELYTTAPSQPDGVVMTCGGVDYPTSNVAAYLKGTNAYQVNFSVYDSFPAALVGAPNGCTVVAKIGSTSSSAKAVTIVPQIKVIVPGSDSDHFVAWGTFGNSYAVSYLCDGGPSSNGYVDAAYVSGKTNNSFNLYIPGATGHTCHFYMGETLPNWVENTRPFDFTP